MHKLEKLTVPVETIYRKCISTMTPETKKEFEHRQKYVVSYSQEYETKIQSGDILKLPQAIDVIGMEKRKFQKIYTQKLLTNPAREYYDAIMSLAKYDICPYCLQNTVSTLDHFMPKSKYLPLAVTPSNLIPCCQDCNKNKLDIPPTSNGNVLFNPYFDDIRHIHWLQGTLDHSNNKILSITFKVALKQKNKILEERLKNYFKTFKLNNLYSKCAARHFIDITTKHILRIKRFGYAKSKDSIVADIEETLEALEISNINGWKTVAYRTLKFDSWYLDYYLRNYDKLS